MCDGFITPTSQASPNKTCAQCRTTVRKIRTKSERLQRQLEAIRKKKKCLQRKKNCLQNKLSILRSKLDESKKKCAMQEETVLSKAIEELPPVQQEAVMSCFSAAKKKGKQGRRYTKEWIFECLLMRVKSPALYEHIRKRNILPLPAKETLTKYIRNINANFGFHKSLFACLKKKAESMAPELKKGSLLLDEMQLSERIYFDRRTFKNMGFTDLGKHTPLSQLDQPGNHGLVFMYQPFRGTWVQTLGSFLSRGCAPGKILHELVLECIILIEEAGFSVDVIVTDGASWNRTMWTKFGVNKNNSSCEHPVDDNRRLWFASDFPHLVKGLRNHITTERVMMTPDGVIKLEHWDEVIKLDNPNSHTLKVCPKLTKSHVHPKPYQKMNVALAFQFFSDSVAKGMRIYKPHNKVLSDAEPSIAFVERINKVIDIMNGKSPMTALKMNTPQRQILQDFIQYLEEWESISMANRTTFLAAPNAIGFKVTINTALELHSYLIKECNHDYLMTSRINQDALERFLGISRSSCGSNTHPDPETFAQMYRLLSAYSLVKPPRGCNVSGGELVQTILNVNDLTNHNSCSTEISLEEKLDAIIQKGTNLEELSQIHLKDHNYSSQTTNEFVKAYIAGYVSRKAKTFTSCESCLATLINVTHDAYPDHDALITLKTRGGLLHPSESMFSLISIVEDTITQVLSTEQLCSNTLFSTVDALENVQIPKVGCDTCTDSLTATLIKFYLITRMHFACNRHMK